MHYIQNQLHYPAEAIAASGETYTRFMSYIMLKFRSAGCQTMADHDGRSGRNPP